MLTLMDSGAGTTVPEDTTATTRTIVAREGTELSDLLREKGWVARAGWRSFDAGQPVWYVRYEHPADEGEQR